MKRKLSFLLVLVMAVASLAGCSGGASTDEASGDSAVAMYEGTPLAEKGDIKIAVIRNLGADEHTAQFLAGAVEEGR